jgi:hypothetical protein
LFWLVIASPEFQTLTSAIFMKPFVYRLSIKLSPFGTAAGTMIAPAAVPKWAMKLSKKEFIN